MYRFNVKMLGFCGVYAQDVFHAIEPNRCYLQLQFNITKNLK